MKLNIPTAITISRLLFSIPMLFLFQSKDREEIFVVFSLFLISSISDFLDGFLARKLKQESDLGRFLDPIADKTAVNIASFGLATLGVIPFFIPAIFIFRDFAVDGARMVFAKKNIVVSAAIYGKLKTLFQMVAILLLLLSYVMQSYILGLIGNVLMFAAVFFSIISGYRYVSPVFKNFS